MSSRYITVFSAFILALMFFMPVKSHSQVDTTGNATEASSQLIYYYDQFDEDSVIQVTNTNDTQSVWVHVQVFRNFDADPDPAVVSPVICDERDFIDFLTPNDTHVYSLSDANFPKNTGETEADAGESTSIDVTNTKGFVVITPVVSEADLTAISFEHLIGTTRDDSVDFVMSAMGRSAVDLATGDKVADGTPLDGVTNGYVLIQPEELIFDFAGDGVAADVDVVGIAFSDVYGDPGLLGYQVTQADATWQSFIFDYKEDPTSCGVRVVSCFLTLGLNDTYGQNNEIFIPSGGSEDLLCTGSSTPDFVDDNTPPGVNFNFAYANFGWGRIFVSGLEGNENHLGVFVETEFAGARWMNSSENILAAE